MAKLPVNTCRSDIETKSLFHNKLIHASRDFFVVSFFVYSGQPTKEVFLTEKNRSFCSNKNYTDRLAKCGRFNIDRLLDLTGYDLKLKLTSAYSNKNKVFLMSYTHAYKFVFYTNALLIKVILLV